MQFVDTPEPIYITTDEEAIAWRDYYATKPKVGYDTETSGLDLIRDRIQFFSMADESTRICAPVRLLHYFKGILENPEIEKRMTNAKYDMHMSHNHGIVIKGRIADTVIMDFLLDENREGRHGLKECAKDYLGLHMAKFKDVFGGEGGKKKSKDRIVEILCEVHTALEKNDVNHATRLLVEMNQCKGDAAVLDSIEKITNSKNDKKNPYRYKIGTLLSHARKHGLADKTHGKHCRALDAANYMGFELGSLSAVDREPYLWVLTDRDIQVDMHDMLLEQLCSKVEHDVDPIEMLTLKTADYASLDSWASYMLVDILEGLLSKEEITDEDNDFYNLLDYYNDWYARLIPAAYDMERLGFRVDIEECAKLEADLKQELGQLSRQITKAVGKLLNPSSTDQL